MKMIWKGGGLSHGYGFIKKLRRIFLNPSEQRLNDIDYKNIICVAEREEIEELYFYFSKKYEDLIEIGMGIILQNILMSIRSFGLTFFTKKFIGINFQ